MGVRVNFVSDGNIVGHDLSCWPADLPVVFGHTTDEARFFVRSNGPYGAPPNIDPRLIYTRPP